MYRIAMERLLGLRLRKDELIVDPCIPSQWEGFSATIRHKSAVYEITVTNPKRQSKGVAEMYADGLPVDRIVMADDGRTHNVRIVMGEVQDEVASRRIRAIR